MTLLRTFHFFCLAKNSLHYASYGNPHLNKCPKSIQGGPKVGIQYIV